MESISCIFCGVDDSFPAIQENGFTGRKCRRCGSIYVSPRPSRDEIANLYGHDHADISAAFARRGPAAMAVVIETQGSAGRA